MTRRMLLFTLAALLLSIVFAPSALAVAAPMPCAPDVEGCVTPTVTKKVYADTMTTYKGWAKIDLERCFAAGSTTLSPDGPYCKVAYTQVMCFRAPCPPLANPTAAWGWSYGSRQWIAVTAGTQVYAWPFPVAGWEWIWTSGTGWLATRSALVMVTDGHCYYPSNCPMF